MTYRRNSSTYSERRTEHQRLKNGCGTRKAKDQKKESGETDSWIGDRSNQFI
jgi:hypothetical protein